MEAGGEEKFLEEGVLRPQSGRCLPTERILTATSSRKLVPQCRILADGHYCWWDACLWVRLQAPPEAPWRVGAGLSSLYPSQLIQCWHSAGSAGGIEYMCQELFWLLYTSTHRIREIGFLRGRNNGDQPRTVSNLHKTTQLVGARARIQTQGVVLRLGLLTSTPTASPGGFGGFLPCFSGFSSEPPLDCTQAALNVEEKWGVSWPSSVRWHWLLSPVNTEHP